MNIPPIVEYAPTELPSIDATTFSCDRLFKLSDGSYLLVEFESDYKKDNFLKYLCHVPRILQKLGADTQLHLLVVYTADVQSAPSRYQTAGVTLTTEQAFLTHIDGDPLFKGIRATVESGEPIVTDDILYLAILPLTYRGVESKRQAIDEAIDIVKLIGNTDDAKFLLAAIAVANDKFMTQEQYATVERMLTMTGLGKAIYEDIIAPGEREAEARGIERGIVRGKELGEAAATERIARTMLAMGHDVQHVMEATGLSETAVSHLIETQNEDRK